MYTTPLIVELVVSAANYTTTSVPLIFSSNFEKAVKF